MTSASRTSPRSPVRRGQHWLAVVAVAVAGLVGCASPRPNLTISVKEFEIRPHTDAVETRNLFLDLDNEGAISHELLVVPLPPGGFEALPVTDTGQLDVSKVLLVDRVRSLPPGRYRMHLPRYLPPGTYAFVCNLTSAGADGRTLSHFQEGMRAPIVITGQIPGTEELD